MRVFKLMQSTFIESTVALVLFGILSGCAGNGNGLDENGNPIGSNGGDLPAAFEPTFTNIQTNVFSSICVSCHFGGAASQGLNLEEAIAYDRIVNVRSTEKPELLLILPGNPNDSYLIRKLEGGPDIVGGQMPLNQTPLSQARINAIRVWIAQGAPRN